MKRTRRGWKPALSLAVVTFFVFASTVRAKQPITFPFNTTGTNVWTDGCSFPVTYDLTSSGTGTVFLDENGLPERVHLHVTEQDTFYANGRTVVGTPYTYNLEILLDDNLNDVRVIANGIAGKAQLPDGGLFIASGKIDFTAQGVQFSFSPDHGTVQNLDGLCAALAP
jgi:hypothetical protein